MYQTLHTNTSESLVRMLGFASQSRAPLRMQAHKPIPIATYMPKFVENYSISKRYDPDAERNATNKLKAMYKKERKGAIRELRKEFAKSTNHSSANDDLIVESAYWAPAVMDREDRLLHGAFPERVEGWFSGLNNLTHRISNGSSISLLPLALSGLVRHVPGIPKIHWPTLRWWASGPAPRSGRLHW